jgi:cyanophycinase-like exopeptidase
MTNKGRIIFGVGQEVQSEKSFAIVPHASLLVDRYHRARTLGAGTCVSIVAVVHSGDGQELVMKLLFVNKEEEEE